MASVPDATLVIVGADRTWPRQPLRAQAAALGVLPNVQFRDYVPEEELAALYARASAFAFLSSYEDAAELVPLHDIERTASALARLLPDGSARAARLAHADAVLARYSWDRAASETLGHLERIARR